ncbi:MAG: serine/threonine-protein kinase, partial [Verrucomicrobiales bacterium]|nr:serine/threonine-protein kinase [Verrucomicrobiales bacterium]
MEETPEPSPSAPFASPGSTGDWVPPGIVELQPLLPEYQLSLVLGVGGMGAVYRGTDGIMGREVAIKILPVSAIEEDGMNYVERFKQEARAMALLNHPSIVKVYGCGEAGSKEDGNEILWFAMEYVEGSDIHHYLHDNGGRLAPEHAMAIICHVLDGLSAAHAQNLIHRDIKPANIMLDHEGHVKITDFGLAKSIDGNDLGLTMTNVAMGTPDYVAPESLIAGAPVDGRADLYSVGAMLYQLLTGGVPRGQFKMPSEKVPGLDRRFDAIVSRALQTEPEDRYPDAASFRADLNEILLLPEADFSPQSGAVKIAQGRKINTLSGVTSPVSVAASHTGPRTVAVEEKSKTGLIVGAIAALLVIGAGAFFFLKPKSPTSVATVPLAMVDRSTVTKKEAVPEAEKVDPTGYNEAPNPVTSGTVQGTVSKSEPEAVEEESATTVVDTKKAPEPGDLLAIADPQTGEAPEAWTRFPDGSLQIDSRVLKEGEQAEKHKKTFLSIPGDFSLPYRLEMDIEMVDRNESLSIMFPVKGRAANLRINQAAKYNPSSVLFMPPNPRSEGLAYEQGDRKTLTIEVTPWKQGANVEVFLDGKLLLERAGGTALPNPLDSLKLAVWPDSVWKFHRISLSKPEPGEWKPKDPAPVEMTSAPGDPNPATEPTLDEPSSAGKADSSDVPEILRSRVARYREVIESHAVEPYREKVLALSQSYESAIDRAVESAADGGNLELVISLRQEKGLVEKLTALVPES